MKLVLFELGHLRIFPKGSWRSHNESASALLNVLRREVVAGSEIHADECSAYKPEQHGHKRFKVNHHKHFVNPHTGRTHASDRGAMARARNEGNERDVQKFWTGSGRSARCVR